MIKVLQIIDGKSYGGIAKLMIDIEKNISEDIKLDYLTANNIDKKFYNLNIDRSTLRGRLIFNHRLRTFLKKNKYDIIHINSGAFFFVFCCTIICKLSGAKIIITHSHNTPNIKNIKKVLIKMLNPLFRKITTQNLTCSAIASKSLYTKTDDVIVIKNGIEIDKYKFDKQIRDEYRKKLNLEKKQVYGHIGRFNEQKNHDFLINLFYEIQKKDDNSVLLLVGDGPLKSKMEEKVSALGINDKVLFLGFQNDVYKILNAMDIFIFPSLYEGLPIALVEAQTNGLPVIASNNITDEVKISDNFIKIEDYNIEKWLNKISSIKKLDRTNAYQYTMKFGYDIKQTAMQLEQIYRNLIK